MSHRCPPHGAERLSARMLRAVGVTAAVLALLVGATLSLQPRNEELAAVPGVAATPSAAVPAAPSSSPVGRAVAGWRPMRVIRPGSGVVLVPEDAVTGRDGRASVMCPDGADWRRMTARPGRHFSCPSGRPGMVWSTG